MDDEAIPPVDEEIEAAGLEGVPGLPEAGEFLAPAGACEVIAIASYPADPAPAVEAPAMMSGVEPLAAAVRELGETLGRRLDDLRTAFDREIRAEATREKVVDRLHAELQEYKNDLLLQTLRPMFTDLIQLHDDIGKIIDAHEADEHTERLLGFMAGFQQGIEDILYRQGVEPFEVEGETFDPRRQRAVATVPTDEAGRGKTVAQRHRKGFRAGEKVIRPEIVSVYSERR